MRFMTLALLAAVGCASSEIGIIDPDDTDGDGEPDVTDTDVDTDTDTDTDPDTDTDTDPDTEPAPARWEGEREFTFGSVCRDTLTESGVDVTNDPEWADWVAACEGCEGVFFVTVAEDDMCGIIPVTKEFVSGVVPEGRLGFRLLRLFEQRGRIRSYTVAEGQTRDGVYFYDYDGTYQGTDYTVAGVGEVIE